MQRHDSRYNEVIFHAEARWLSRGKVLERVFQTVTRVAVFLCSTRIHNIHKFSKLFLALFQSEFSVMDRAAIYMWGNWLGPFACSCNSAENGRPLHQGRNEEVQFPASKHYGFAKSVQGVPNGCGDAEKSQAPQNPNNVTSTSFNIEHTLPKDLSFEYGSPNLLFAPGAI